MIPISKNSILTSEEATKNVQELLLDFMHMYRISNMEEVSEHLQVDTNWDLVITCQYKDEAMVIHIPGSDWVPSANV